MCSKLALSSTCGYVIVVFPPDFPPQAPFPSPEILAALVLKELLNYRFCSQIVPRPPASLSVFITLLLTMDETPS